jgi:hypothetical protein
MEQHLASAVSSNSVPMHGLGAQASRPKWWIRATYGMQEVAVAVSAHNIEVGKMAVGVGGK